MEESGEAKSHADVRGVCSRLCAINVYCVLIHVVCVYVKRIPVSVNMHRQTQSKYHIEGNLKYALQMKSFLVIQTYLFVQLIIFLRLGSCSCTVFCLHCALL